MWMYRTRLHRDLGPVDNQTIYDLIEKGDIGPNTRVQKLGETEWELAKDTAIKVLFDDDPKNDNAFLKLEIPTSPLQQPHTRDLRDLYQLWKLKYPWWKQMQDDEEKWVDTTINILNKACRDSFQRGYPISMYEAIQYYESSLPKYMAYRKTSGEYKSLSVYSYKELQYKQKIKKILLYASPFIFATIAIICLIYYFSM